MLRPEPGDAIGHCAIASRGDEERLPDDRRERSAQQITRPEDREVGAQARGDRRVLLEDRANGRRQSREIVRRRGFGRGGILYAQETAKLWL